MAESDRRLVLGYARPRFRRFLQVWLVVVLGFFLATFLLADSSAVIRVSAGLNLLAAVLLLAGSRSGTAADTHGIEIAGGFRIRRIPWDAIEELRAEHSQWTDPKVEVWLTDGSTRGLPGVSADDLPRLEKFAPRRG